MYCKLQCLNTKNMCSEKEKTKDKNVKTFNMITNKNEAKTMTKYISCNCKYKFNSTTCNSNQKWNYKSCQCECKIIASAERLYLES